MKTFLTLLLATLCAASGYGQTIKSLGYNTTNGQVVANTGTNVLMFTNDNMVFQRPITFQDDVSGNAFEASSGSNSTRLDATGIFFGGLAAATTRTNLGLGANFLTNTNAANFRTAIGLGATNDVVFNELTTENNLEIGGDATFANAINVNGNGIFFNTNAAAATRTNLGLGSTNNVAFRNITSDGNIVITNQTATNNGILFVYRTNNEPFLGLANLIASNNTTISNETLFRVGVAEATNRSAQFGFRSTNTNGSGVAVFSVFGYNALMMIGVDASTNAVIYSGGGTNNEVMTLIRDGATEFARPIRFSTNASTRPSTNAPANTTNVAAWVEMRIGTNSYRVPLYQ